VIGRARLLAVATIVACGAIGVISSTQTWLVAVLDDGARHALAVPGASAVPVLAPLSLAVLALGAALSIVGLVLRYVFAGLTLLIGALLGALSAQVAFARPVSSVAATVTEATGITGETAVAELVAEISTTPWPAVTLIASAVLLVAGLFTIATARRWKGSGRRYRTDASAGPSGAPASRPHDAIDSWDDLSRGEDPTARPLD
jgi:uncharacterized membrane protein (TIGR02234 family)